MRSFYKVLHVTITSCFISLVADAQDLSRLGKGSPLKVTGGVSANQIFYLANGIDNRRTPYSYFLSGNLNLNVYEFNMPVSFTFSNQNISLQQPFNQFGAHRSEE